MHLNIDGQASVQDDSGDLLGVVTRITSELRSQGRAVVALTINGEPVLPDDLYRDYESQPAHGANVEITTRPLQELVLETLNELAETLPELPQACRHLALVFQSDVPSDGFEPFKQLAEIWNHVKERQHMVADALDIPLERMEVHGQTVAAHSKEFNAFLSEAAQAIQDGDSVLLGDLLEYELAPRAELEAEIVSELKRRAEAAVL